MNEYKCNVIINFEGNHIEAENKQDYIEKLKESFMLEFGIELSDSEIQNVEVIK
tara:strand:+ start:1844 stop:2005 length:162 start_codon:yes stop_codon:yes gene_type:complete